MTKFNYRKDQKKNHEKRTRSEHKGHLIIGLTHKTGTGFPEKETMQKRLQSERCALHFCIF